MNNPDGGETSETIWTDSVLDLAVNAAGYQLAHPGADLEDAIAAAWADLGAGISWPEEYDGTPEDELPAKGTPEYNAAVVSTVLGWIS